MENQYHAAPKKNGLATAGLVLGIIACVFVLIQAILGVSVAGLIATILSVFAWPFAILAIVFGIIGAIGDKPKKTTAIVALGLGVLAIILYFVIPQLLYS